MRGHLAGLVLLFTLAAPASGQTVLGTYTITAAQGGTITLVLRKDTQGKIVGSFAGNGASFAVQAEVQGDGVTGSLSGGGMRSYFEAQREGADLHMIVADVGSDGKPDYIHAREFTMTATGAATGAPVGAPVGAPAPSKATSSLAKTAQDQQIATVLMSNAWCSFSFSGSSNYSSGRSSSSRAVFRADGMATETQNGESTNSGSAGSVYGSSTNARQGRWRIENGQLMLSADGVQWAPQSLKIADNGSGSLIVTSGGKEYMVCR